MDRVLYKQFEQILENEKLRPGEAIESLVRLAVQAGGVSTLYTDQSKLDRSGSMVDEALFKSRLARLKASLELEEMHLRETSIELDDKDSETLVDKLTELGRRSISAELVKEFEACLSNADRLYQEGLKSFVEQEIRNTRSKREMREMVGWFLSGFRPDQSRSPGQVFSGLPMVVDRLWDYGANALIRNVL